MSLFDKMLFQEIRMRNTNLIYESWKNTVCYSLVFRWEKEKVIFDICTVFSSPTTDLANNLGYLYENFGSCSAL